VGSTALSGHVGASYRRQSEYEDKEFIALPGAFESVLKDHPTAMGFIPEASAFRAPGMSAMQQHYEVLSTAALKLNDVVTLSARTCEFTILTVLILE